MGHRSNDYEDCPNHCEYDGKSMKTETTTWSKFPNRGKAIVEQTLASQETNPNKQDYKNYSLGSKWENYPSE